MGNSRTKTDVKASPLSPEEQDLYAKQVKVFDFLLAEFDRNSRLMQELYPETRDLIRETTLAGTSTAKARRDQMESYARLLPVASGELTGAAAHPASISTPPTAPERVALPAMAAAAPAPALRPAAALPPVSAPGTAWTPPVSGAENDPLGIRGG